MELLKSQKNKLFDIINSNGLSPREFNIIRASEYNFDDISRVEHINTGYFFSFLNNNNNNFFVRYSPGRDKVEDFKNLGSWDLEIQYFVSWLSFLKREIEAPDKWEQLLEEEEFFKSDFNEDDNTRFSYEEVKNIEASVQKLKDGLKKIGISQEEIKVINNKLDYLVDRSKKVGKVDWKNIAIGTLINIASTLAMQHPKETVAAFIQLVKVSFKAILLLQ